MASAVTTPAESPTPTIRELVAAEVRAELARRRLNSNQLPPVIGKSQRYWYQRINAQIPFSLDDLAALSGLLGVPMSQFISAEADAQATQKAPTPKGEGQMVHPLGLEPRTH